MYKGIDVSEHNGIIDWRKVAASGIDFAVIRAGLGCKSDARFEENIQGASRAGLAVCVYWFAYALDVNGATKEADFCAKIIVPYGKRIHVYYDFEYDTERYAAERNVQYSKRSRTDIIKAFCDRMKKHGYRCGVYINIDYLAYRTNRTELSKYPLWLAAWRRADGIADFSTTSPDDLPDKYKGAMIWQFGKCSFGGQDIDINYGYFKPEYKVGGQYMIKSGDTYTNGIAVPKRLVGKSFTIAQVKSDRILLREIMSWVRI